MTALRFNDIADLMLESVSKRALDKGISLNFGDGYKNLLYANGKIF